MEETKHLLQSRTVWGATISILCAVLMALGYSVDDAAQSQMVEVGLSIGAVVGGLLSVYGRIKATKSVTAKTGTKASGGVAGVLLLFLLVPVALPGCALKDLSPHEKGLAVGNELNTAYAALHQEYLSLHASLPPAGVLFLEKKVAPAMDTAKRAIVAYDDAAIIYARTKTKPLSWSQLLIDAETALQDCTALFIKARSYLYSEGGE
ncbi:hypothetical protein [Desulfovibrio psychrotolerans]|uniref:Uncharacterized protein n=1 Tax=Desulfovibrio psychrotolerans TaxID=415242 RepID=A0A7J0BX72_9BACT|nr:hypothetical protein [Desulfovibrio psychrotolerans]GFM38306.1 hypothetical protein DSM19430T_29900 [Desulfovibrio psychrotolerans]